MTATLEQIFFELYEGLPRQGPGNRACAERALGLCAGLPKEPKVLDLGCGTGAQTLHLAELTGGFIVAIDQHAPSVERLRRRLVADGLAGTDAVWRSENPPPSVKASFDEEYPTMGTAGDVRDLVGRSDFSLVGHFTLPDEAWWDEFYTPMQQRIEALRGRYRADRDGLAALDQLAEEPEMHRKHSHHYAYEFFVAVRDAV